MRILVQKVVEAKVEVGGATIGKIGKGLLVFVAIHKEDTAADCLWMKEKLLHLRIFPDEQEKLNLSIQEVRGELLIVSQFTLYADCSKGRRPSFTESAPPHLAESLYDQFVQEMKEKVATVQTGQFRAYMQVHLINDGPLTFLLDSKERVPVFI